MEANQELYNYITNNFGKVTVLDNGLFYSTDKYGNELFINPKSGTNVDLVVSYPGIEDGDSAQVKNLMSGQNPPNYCAFVSHNHNDSSNLVEIANNVLTGNNYNVNGVVISSFSASGGMGMQSASMFVNNHLEYKDKIAVIVNEGNNVETQRTSCYETFINSDIPVILISGESGGGPSMVNKDTVFLENKGINVFRVFTEDDNHVNIPYGTFHNGMPEYILGSLSDIRNDGKDKNANYRICKYNP